MRDFGEFRRHWRVLLAAFLGLASALSLNSYILSTFAPYLIAEFEWSRAQWALLGIVQAFTLIGLPVAGRLTDIFGVRRVAAVGALSFPFFLVAIAMMNGNVYVYLAIYIGQTLLGSLTTTTVYARVVAQEFKVHRGLALGIFGCSTPLVAALGAPLITMFVADHGWRAGYLAIAGFSMACAVLTLALLPRDAPQRSDPREPASQPLGVYRAIAAMPAFWVMLLATFLVNFPFTVGDVADQAGGARTRRIGCYRRACHFRIRDRVDRGPHRLGHRAGRAAIAPGGGDRLRAAVRRPADSRFGLGHQRGGCVRDPPARPVVRQRG